jgi:hypothetical protein
MNPDILAAASHAIKIMYLQQGRDILATITQVVDVLNEEGADVGLCVAPSLDCIHILDLRSQNVQSQLEQRQPLETGLQAAVPSSPCVSQPVDEGMPMGEALMGDSQGHPFEDVGQSSYCPSDGEVLEGQTQSLFKAWGVRHRNHSDAKACARRFAGTHCRSLQSSSATLPASAIGVDPALRTKSGRSQGGYTTTLPFHKRYGYYRTFGATGRGATSSSTHNFPVGQSPKASRVYTA